MRADHLRIPEEPRCSQVMVTQSFSGQQEPCLDALAFARFALGCLLFMGDANLFPKFARGSFLVTPSGKCLEHTRD